MTEINTKETPGPFDGFATAKPGEPIFTLQGGDPVAAQLVNVWASLARIRSGDITLDGLELENAVYRLRKLAEPVDSPAKAKALLLRASEAEKVAWDMDEYRRGYVPEPEERATYSGEAPDKAAVAAKAESDARLYHSRRLDNAVTEMTEAMGFAEAIAPDVVGVIETAVINARFASDEIRPSR